jgi:iron complex transport system substrate-binding protein
LIQAEELSAVADARLQNVIELTIKTSRRPRVFCLEWIDPYYCCGHWVPEMVELAGGQDALGRKGADSVRISWTDIAGLSPEILVVSPCGFGVQEAAEQAKQLLQQPGWNDLPAVLNDRVSAVDANAYFARPGPRVVDGVEIIPNCAIGTAVRTLSGRFTFPTSTQAAARERGDLSRMRPGIFLSRESRRV